MPVDYSSLPACQNEIVRLERLVATLRLQGPGDAPLLDVSGEGTRSITEARLVECLGCEERAAAAEARAARAERLLAVEQVRARILAMDSARRVGDAMFRKMTQQGEQQIARGITEVPTVDLMVLLTALDPAPDAD